jgi:hypothetical protein
MVFVEAISFDSYKFNCGDSDFDYADRFVRACMGADTPAVILLIIFFSVFFFNIIFFNIGNDWELARASD